MSDIETLQRQLEQKEQELAELRNEYDTYKKETLEYEKVFEEDNEFKEKEIAQLTETNKRLEQKLTESKKEIKEVTALLDKEKEKFKKVNDEYKEVRRKIMELEQTNDCLENENRQLVFTEKEVETKVAELEENLVVSQESLKAMIATLTDEIDRLRQEKKELEEEILAAKLRASQSVNKPEESSENKEKGDEDLTKEKENMQQQIAELKGIIAQFEGQMEANKQQFETNKEQHLSEIKALTEEFEKTKSLLSEAQNENAQIKASSDTLVIEKERLIEEMTKQANEDKLSYENALKSKDNELAEAKEQNEKYIMEIESLKKDEKGQTDEKQIQELTQALEAYKLESEQKVLGLTQELSQSREEAEKNIKELENTIANHVKRIQELNEQLVAEKEAHHTEKKNLEDSLLEKQNEVAKLNEQHQAEVQELTDEIIRLKVANDGKTSEEEEESLRQLLTAREEELNKAVEETNEQKAANATLETEIKNLESQLNQKIEELQNSKQRIQTLEERISSLEQAQATHEADRQEMEKIMAMNEQLSQTNATLETQFNEAIQTLQQAELIHQKETSNLKEILNDRIKELKTYQDNQAETVAEIERLKIELEKTGSLLKDRDVAIDEILQKNLRLEQALEDQKALLEERRASKAEIEKKDQGILESRPSKADIFSQKPPSNISSDLRKQKISKTQQNADPRDRTPVKSSASGNKLYASPARSNSLNNNKYQPEAQHEGTKSGKKLPASSQGYETPPPHKRHSSMVAIDSANFSKASAIKGTPTKKTQPYRYGSVIHSPGLYKAGVDESARQAKCLLYVKPTPKGQNTYLHTKENKVFITKPNAKGYETKLYLKYQSFNEILTSTHNLDLANRRTDPKEILGKNLFFAIYGTKHTDKKKLKYKLLHDLIKYFSVLLQTESFKNKQCRMRIKVHDDNLANKFDTLKKGGWDLYEHYEEREFILNEDFNEIELFFAKMKQVDTSSIKIPSKKSNLKQIFLQFVFLDSHGQEIVEPQAKTKIMIVTTNEIQPESAWEGFDNFEAVIDLLLTRDRTSALLTGMYERNTKDEVKKHFIIAVNPIATNHRLTLDSVGLASKIEQINLEQAYEQDIYRMGEGNMNVYTPEKQTAQNLKARYESNYARMSEVELFDKQEMVQDKDIQGKNNENQPGKNLPFSKNQIKP